MHTYIDKQVQESAYVNSSQVFYNDGHIWKFSDHALKFRGSEAAHIPQTAHQQT